PILGSSPVRSPHALGRRCAGPSAPPREPPPPRITKGISRTIWHAECPARARKEGAMQGVLSYVNFPGLQDLAMECARSPVFHAAFATEEGCESWFIRQRWPGGFSCPRCHGAGRWLAERRGFECRSCRKFTSLTAGTLL